MLMMAISCQMASSKYKTKIKILIEKKIFSRVIHSKLKNSKRILIKTGQNAIGKPNGKAKDNWEVKWSRQSKIKRKIKFSKVGANGRGVKWEQSVTKVA